MFVRLSEPTIRIVCGSPGSISAILSCRPGIGWSFAATSVSRSSDETETAVATETTIRTDAVRKRHQSAGVLISGASSPAPYPAAMGTGGGPRRTTVCSVA